MYILLKNIARERVIITYYISKIIFINRQKNKKRNIEKKKSLKKKSSKYLKPHVPLTRTSYDFTCVANYRIENSYTCILLSNKRYTIEQALYTIYLGNSQLHQRDGRCVQDQTTSSPQRSYLRLLTIPTSCFRVSENNPN